jgi:lysophospholipase L1-like esterase
VIGDSTTEWGDPNWPEVLRDKFDVTSDHTNTNVEVWDLSRPSLRITRNSTSPYDYRNTNMFQWAIKSEPDIVFIMIGTNDVYMIWYED